jgi:hypothetical protein
MKEQNDPRMNDPLSFSERVQPVEYMELPGWSPASAWHPGLEPATWRATHERPARPARRMVTRFLGLVMLAVVMLAAPAASNAQLAVGISVSFGPPALPIYYQPPCPAYGYIWTPGFWAWDPDYGYYWVPGTWVTAPFQGALWTPGYWAFNDGVYVWNEGYWGPVVGYYGGIVYGFGYTGYGYQGGYWRGGNYYYNRSVNNISTTNITYVYNNTVVSNTNVTRVSYNGGSGGTTARPTSEQLAAARGRRFGPVADQQRQMQIAESSPQQRANVNKGRPAIAATARPGAFSGGEAVEATRAGAPYKAPKAMPQASPQNRGAERSMPAGRAPEAATPRREAPPRTEMPAPRSREVQPNVERPPVERAPGAQAGGPGRGRAPEASKPGKAPKAEKPHKPHDE